MSKNEESVLSPQLQPNLHLELGSASDARSFIPFQVSPSSALASTSPISLSSPQPDIPPAINKARGELKKLLAHLLSRLKARPAAPSIYDNINPDSTRKEFHRLGEVVETVKGAVRFKSPKDLVNSNDRPEDEDDAVDAEEDFSTNVTHNLMSQLRDILIMSAKQGLHIFESTESEEPTSIRRLRSSRQFSQRSRASSFSGSSQPPNLLIESIEVLASVISEDCRFRTSSTRLFCPPYSLQSVSLDVAQCLIKAHSHDPKILSRIGFAVIPAFSTFNSSLHARLLAFFEDGIIRGILADLQSLQGFALQSKKDVNEEDSPIKTPVVAIQVEKAVDDSPAHLGSQGWLKWNNHASPRASNLLSSVAPSQPLAIYYLSSLIPPLLVAVLDAIDPFEQDIRDIPMFYRLQTLIRTIVSMKRDAYLDFLEVVAYHSPQTRRKALAVLATFWPKALGHVVIGKSLPLISYSDSLPDQTPSTKLRYTNPPRDHPYAHEFVPWRFFVKDASAGLDYGIIRNTCQSCYGAISGFGLLCPFCLTSAHLNCYDAPDGMFQGQYSVTSGPDSKQCFVSFSNTLPWRKDVEPEIIMNAEHTFRSANLFTLALCMVCRKPLWGYVKQGLKCSLCKQFVHLSCASSSAHTLPSCPDFALSESHVVIDKVTLQKSFVDYYKEILIDEEELHTKTYEDISVFYCVLWAQLCIFENGIAYKSIVTEQGSGHLDNFELQRFVHLYETFLSSRRLAMSANVQEYYDLNKNLQVTEHAILFDWPFLANVVSVIKSPLPTHPLATSNLLTVSERDMDDFLDIPSHPYELVPLSQMRSALGFEFQIYSDSAAQYMLSHIRLVGFFDQTDHKDELFDSPAPLQVLCSFPLPSGLDLSTSVETMVVAIESCLRDIDVAVNEHGFLLLVRRFWPTGAASEYALTRLTRIVLSWVLAEDDRLVIIARDHVARNHNLPGVRSPYDIPPWPSSSRHGSNKGIHSGGEYVLCRKLLLIRHALPWLSAVHSLDIQLYTSCLYEYCEEVYDASENNLVSGVLHAPNADSERKIEAAIARCDVVLRSITKLSQSNVAMSTFETLLTRWFDSIASSPIPRNSCIFKSLSRLFSHETDVSHRTSTMNDSLFVTPDSLQIDPWRILDKVASEDLQGFERSLSWLHVMAHSAVEIPIPTLKRIFELAGKFHASFSMVASLLESAMTFVWPKSFGSSGLVSVIIETIKIWENELVRRMRFPEESEEIHDFLRYSLITCLLEYGCERQAMVSLGLISSGELANMPQRRRVPRASAPSAIIIDPRLVTILSRFVNDGPDSVCALIAKFLNTLVSESVLLETHEIDEFILINGDALSQCAWRFYDLTSQELSDIRASFLVRILAVDPQPFDALLHEILQTSTNWQGRYFAVTRLFRIVLDVTSPSFGVEGRQWKSNVADVINHFLKTLWMDDREEVRLAVYSSTQTLLPAHLRVISSFWTEVMTKSPISDRARMSAFLVQLHPHFPAWQLLLWDTIVEVLLDDDFVQQNNEGGDAYAAAQKPPVHEYSSSQGQVNGSHRSDPDAETLQVSMTILSLKMIADGIPIDVLHLLKLKFILSKVLGFKSTFFFPSAGGQAYHVQIGSLDGLNQFSYPLIAPLMRVIDAPHVLSLSPSAMGVSWNELPVTGLVGDVFMDIVSRLWEKIGNVQKLPYDVLRALLESMLLAIVKHDLNSPALKHLDDVVCEAVKSVTNLVLSESSYDLRHLCLSVMQAFMREYPVLGLRILGHQVTVLTRFAVSLHFRAEDSLMLQTTEFLESAFEQYEVTGLFWLLSKQGRLSEDFFLVLRMVVNGPNSSVNAPIKVLGDSIIQDTLSKVAANTTDPAVPDALHNLEKYVAICHHHPYPDNLIHHIGLRLTAIARQIMDNTSFNMNRAHAFDPSPLLSMSATIMQHHKEQSLDLVSHTETLLHVALSRFGVHAETLNRLLRVISATYQDSKQAEVGSIAESPANHVIASVMEMLSDSLTGKIRALPSTTTAMLEATISLHKDDSKFMPISALYRVGADALSYLAHPVYRETYNHVEFAASLAAAKLFLQISGQDTAFFSQTLVGDSRVLTPVRVWNLVALAALSSAETYTSPNLLAILPSFVASYVTSLKEPLSGTMNDSAASNVNHALASVKLWMLIAHRARDTTEINYPGPYADERMVWDQLWSSFERLLVLSQAESPNGEMHPLSSFIAGCVSDLILFIRQSRSVVALDTYFHVFMLNKLHVSSRRDSAGSKFSRTLREISEPSGDHTFEMLVSQVASDVFAAEKLQAIESYKTDKRREVTDRRRIDARELRATS